MDSNFRFRAGSEPARRCPKDFGSSPSTVRRPLPVVSSTRTITPAADMACLAVAGGDRDPARQTDHILPAGRPVPAVFVVRGGFAKHDAGRRQSFRQLAGGRLLLYQSTSMSRKCDSPLASSYTLWIRIAAHSCICPHFPDSGRERLILRINRALGNKIGSRSRYQRIY